MNFLNKRILLIVPSFFGYDLEIKKRLESLGANVDHFDERPANNFWTKALIRINKSILTYTINRYYNKILIDIEGNTYDYVLIVNIEAMPLSFIERIKKLNAKALFILYMWDSFSNKINARDSISFFDAVYSFDKRDCADDTRVLFRPLFYLPEYSLGEANSICKYDLSFIGTAHSDRLILINQINLAFSKLGLNTYFFLFIQSVKLFLYQKIINPSFKNAKLNDFSRKSLSKIEMLDVILNSKIVLDIHHPKQTGLTMRSIEVLGASRKLITTNSYIKEYDFYNENNILIIDRKNPVISSEFINSSYEVDDNDIRYKYSLDGWIFDLFSHR